MISIPIVDFTADGDAQGWTAEAFIYGLIQRDYNKDNTSEADGILTKFDYNSWYIGIGSSGPLSDRLLYGLEAAYEGGRSISNSFTTEGGTLPTQIPQTHDTIEAWAADARLDYLLADPHHSRLGTELILASGDHDRTNTTTTSQATSRARKTIHSTDSAC